GYGLLAFFSAMAALYSSTARATRSGASCPTQRSTIAPASARVRFCDEAIDARTHIAMFAAAAVASFVARSRCAGVHDAPESAKAPTMQRSGGTQYQERQNRMCVFMSALSSLQHSPRSRFVRGVRLRSSGVRGGRRICRSPFARDRLGATLRLLAAGGSRAG